jgi:hypothetical protein
MNTRQLLAVASSYRKYPALPKIIVFKGNTYNPHLSQCSKITYIIQNRMEGNLGVNFPHTTFLKFS